MFLDLLPEVLGLIATPGAIAACILLLQSQRPISNATSFGVAFVLVYAVVAVIVGTTGSAADAAGADAFKHVVGTVLGALFLLAALALVLGGRHRRRDAGSPQWMRALESCSPRRAFAVGVVMAIANPNLAIFFSGMSIVITADVSSAERVGGSLLLLASCAVDFVVPILAFVLLKERGRLLLDRSKNWMVHHDRALTVSVLVVFGTMFLVRGVVGLA